MRSRKRSMLFHLVCLITTLMLTLGLTGCTNSINNLSPTESVDISTEVEDVVITFSYDENAYSLIKPLMEAFHEENPSITVQYVPLTTEDYNTPETVEERLLMLAESADTTLTSIRIAEMSSYFLDLQPLIDADSTFDQADFWPGSLSAMEDTQGRVLGLPMTLFLRGIFYDKAAFDAANLSYPQPGWTWDDFRIATAALAQVQGADIRFGYADRTSASILEPLIGSTLAQNDGVIDADTLSAELDWYVQMVHEDQILGMKSTDDYWNALFNYAGAPAMWYGSLFEFILGSITGEPEASDLMTYFTESGYGFAPFPIDPDGENVNTTPVNALCGVISAGSEHPAEAWQWLKYLSEHWLVSDTGNANNQLHIPARQSVAEAEGFWDNYPTEVQAAMQYGLEYAWYSSLYSRAENAVLNAVEDAAEGRATDLLSALEEAESKQASWPQETIDTPEIVIETPQPTTNVSLGAVTIKFNYDDWLPEDVNIFKTLISQFNQEYEGKIVVEVDNAQKESYQGGYFVGRSNLYDCYLAQVAQVMAEMAASSGAVLDLTALFEGEDSAFQQDFDRSLLDTSSYEGYLVALPLSIQPAIMVYNADLIAEKGLQPPTLDWTFNDFLELIKAVTSISGSDKSYGFLPSSNAANGWDLLYAGNGLHWRDITGASPVAMLNTLETADTLIWLDELEQTGVVYQVSSEEDWETAIGIPVRSGQIGFFITYAGEEQELFFADSEPPFTIGIAPIPYTEKPNGSYADNYETGFYISNNSENPEACWEFAKYLSEHTEVLNGVPTRISIANSSAWEAQVGPEKAAVYRKALSNNLSNIEDDPYGAYFWYPIKGWLARAKLNITAGNNPTQALALAQQYANAYIECMAPHHVLSLSSDELWEIAQICIAEVDPSY